MCTTPSAVQDIKAQQYTSCAFPRGLIQPQGAYRFGLDALLLAAWTADCLPYLNKQELPVAELGTGCGAASIGLALLRKDALIYAIEREKPLAHAAQQNCINLGLTKRLHIVQADLTQKTCLNNMGRKHVAAVLANPPWRASWTGRVPQSAMRQNALTFSAQPQACHQNYQANLSSSASNDAPLLFAQTASLLLQHHGRYCCIFTASGLPRLLTALTKSKLGIRRLRFVHTLPHKPAHVVLIEARKNAHDDLCVESPLILHSHTTAAQAKCYTEQARTFCPWLS